ncbi:hypothetical protein BDV28DRAFT_88795 [Aspergillus coremiiformis]|uniref:Major facilitator superfamily (MFS) profile domain-containing protein n=1 Tax=Aspergillus coremiiformis TaxID=138285 RepID=A0A5N6ZBJ8_9EURO|nr:hypothetical protein BDV28DRAFT_88795 [Aspergillus coremiiformis]
MCNFIIGLTIPRHARFHSIAWGTYIFFAVFCLLALAFTFFCIPEAPKKTLENIDLFFGDTAAHEEKERVVQVESEVRGTQVPDKDSVAKPSVEQEYVF